MWHRLSLVVVSGLALSLMSTLGRAGQPAAAHAVPPTSSKQSSESASSASVKAAPSADALRQAVTAALRYAAIAKDSDAAQAVRTLVQVYGELGRDNLLPQKERLRLAVQVRTRLARFANQFRYQLAHGASAAANSALRSASGAAGAPAVDGLNSLVELIQSTIAGRDDWIASQQRAVQQGALQAGNGQGFAGGGAGFGGAGNAGGGTFGDPNGLAQAAAANGADLVDLIQKTVDPPSWDINGGPGSIVYFNGLRALVVRQTDDAQNDVGGLLVQMRK